MAKSPSLAPVRVRFAPSPTGSLHVGGARTALFNWLLAKKTKGSFIVRVEDTDEARSTRESENMILGDLKWMNMKWDEGPEVEGPYGPYRQSERKVIYKKYADQLIASGKAFRCFCTEEELNKKREVAEAAGLDPKYDGTWRNADPVEIQKKLDNNEPYTVRFQVPEGKVVSIDDVVRGKVTWDADASLGDFIILRSNGMPVYNFCVAVDDANMQITHVIRAEEHLTNTLRQMLILEALGYRAPTYAHCSLILGQDRSKLSKRHGATSVSQFAEQGFLPQAMMNYLANLGWNDGTPKEIYSPEELISAFDLNRIVKSSAVFDMDKLRWINGQHLRAIPRAEIEVLVGDTLLGGEVPLLVKESSADVEKTKAFVIRASGVAQKDMELVVDARRLVGGCLKYDLEETVDSDSHVLDVLTETAVCEKVITALLRDYDAGALPTGVEDAFPEVWKTYMKTLGKELDLKGKPLFHTVRLALTGRMSGPDVGDQMQLLHLATGVVNPAFPLITLEKRIEKLRSFSVADSKVKADAAALVHQAAAAAALLESEAAAAAMAEAAAVAPQ
jgi:glutamyl-tRNA synthetase